MARKHTLAQISYLGGHHAMAGWKRTGHRSQRWVNRTRLTQWAYQVDLQFAGLKDYANLRALI